MKWKSLLRLVGFRIWDSRPADLEPSKIFTASLLAWRQNPWTPQPLTRWILVPSAYAVLDIFPYPVYPGRGYSHLNMGPGLTYKRDEIEWIDGRKIMVCRNYLTARQMNLIIRILGRWNRQEKSNNAKSQSVRSILSARSLTFYGKIVQFWIHDGYIINFITYISRTVNVQLLSKASSLYLEGAKWRCFSASLKLFNDD